MNPILIKWAIIAALALGLFGAGAFGTYRYMAALRKADALTMKAQTTTITNLLAAKKRNDDAVKAAEAAKAAARAAAQKARDELAAALLANHAWADTPVPKEVQDALR